MKHPLMSDNIAKDDLEVLVEFLSQDSQPILTNNKKVRQFEQEWGDWIGMPRNVMVNSGSSANEITFLALKQILPAGSEVILPPITWVSDVAAVLHNGFTPVFCDINSKTLAIDEDELEKKITKDTKVVFLTHVLGYNGLTDKILKLCKDNDLILVEDVCESHGATFKGQKVGTFGSISNYSFYYAHHMTSIEGGMVSTTDPEIYEYCRMFRSHGMVRESTSEDLKAKYIADNPSLNSDFIFSEAAYNFRSTEINAVIASNQLKRLDDNNKQRSENLYRFADNLDSDRYITDLNYEGNSNYAFTPILKAPDFEERDRIESLLKEREIEFRRGLSGGGSQIRQPYLSKYTKLNPLDYPVAEHCHNFGWYIGNYPGIEESKIKYVTEALNS
jgi:CDP-6-deoxy-D-xylo-4-hexulose-3-dehydrase